MEARTNHAEVHASFAGALAAFAADTAPNADPDALDAEDAHADARQDGLADDVASFSYEHVLRAHSHRPADDTGSRLAATTHESAALEKNRKSASVTIRLSRVECTQLKKRADAAHLTVSAYMRSCILEAETLRAQVKEALAELRAATPEETRRAVTHAPRRWWRPWPHAGSRSAQA